MPAPAHGITTVNASNVRSSQRVSDAHTAAPPCRSILMVGTDLTGMGGIRTVVQGYIDAGLFDRVDCIYVTTHRPGSPGRKLLAAVTGWAQVAMRLHGLDAPLVHIHLSSRASFWRKSVVCALARLARRPYLLHAHGSEFADFYEECSPVARRIVRSVLANATLVLALSEAWRSTLQRISPQARIEVLMNAVPLPAPAERQRAAGRQPNLLFFGEIARHKGVLEVARAFAAVAAALPALRLVYAGTGRAVAETRALTTQLGLGGRTEFTGWLESERKRAVLADATIFVLPSFVEGVPMALLEAMSLGLPVIATPVGGVPEIVTHEVDGLLVPPGDVAALAAAIARLMNEPQLRERLGRAARATIATRFALDTAVERLLGYYRRFGIEPREPHSRQQAPLTAAAGER
ncbi:MAG TPA: glycosyltransferase family 4 protein [Steroidobacteraceae bacterium]|nr:glycosyltransferase family 4 protein [Steroidobacteraceae bacterium]